LCLRDDRFAATVDVGGAERGDGRPRLFDDTSATLCLLLNPLVLAKLNTFGLSVLAARGLIALAGEGLVVGLSVGWQEYS
jgi:hypothetical protein